MRRFGAFEGVFVPTLLSILGVILFLRLGWVVGQVGIFRALGIILISNTITFITALSLWSIVSNRRIGAGGAYSMISRSLGMEAGGTIGASLYLSQAISVAFYIRGFSELWVSRLFPDHSQLVVSLVVWTCLFLVSQRSARLAFRLQYLILITIALALFSMYVNFPGLRPALSLVPVNGVGFWKAFAVFFPAVTGILAGVNMSGELKDPEKAIPLGTISAILLSFLVYCLTAVWFGAVAPAEELVADPSVAVKYARWPALVIAGIMGATLSSALSMFVSSPRVLLALSKHRIVPGSHWLARTSSSGEPVFAIGVTAGISLMALFLSLNYLAGLLTMIFLMTYGAINLSVLIEQTIGVVSFRPTFRMPSLVPGIGVLGCSLAMFLIDPFFALLAVVLLVSLYVQLLKRGFSGSWPDVRKGLLIFLAEKCLRIARGLPYHPKGWKPNVLFPAKAQSVSRCGDLLEAILFPNGRLVAVCYREEDCPPTKEFVSRLQGMGFFATELCLPGDPISSVSQALYVCEQMFLPANLLFLDFQEEVLLQSLPKFLSLSEDKNLGLLGAYCSGAEGIKTVNLWIREGSPNRDLAILIALHLHRSLEVRLNLMQVVREGEEEKGYRYLARLKEVMRLPADTTVTVLSGDFRSILVDAPRADLNIFGAPSGDGFSSSWVLWLVESLGSSLLILRDSRQESARA